MRIIFFSFFFSNCLIVYPQTPCPRNQPVIEYHAGQQAIFMFGGYCSELKARVNDLWKFHDGEWVEIVNNVSPQARSGHSMVYDSENDQLIIFGGRNDQGDLLNDTWLWNGKWKQLKTVTPPARQSHRMVETSFGIILFGGAGENESLDDTWILKDGEWIKHESSLAPEPRRQHTLAFDRNRDVVVLFGGFDGSNESKITFGDTWEFDGKEWSKIANNPGIARDHHAMQYSPRLKSVILFGGYNQRYFGDTWMWNGMIWQEIQVTGPQPRGGKPGLVVDRNGDLFLYGGWGEQNTVLADFWRLESSPIKWKILEDKKND